MVIFTNKTSRSGAVKQGSYTKLNPARMGKKTMLVGIVIFSVPKFYRHRSFHSEQNVNLSVHPPNYGLLFLIFLASTYFPLDHFIEY